MFDPVGRLLLGFLIGFVFGFLLQKGRLTHYATIVGQFLLRDFTVLKVMLTGIVVGAIGVYGLREFGWVSLDIMPAVVGSVVVGGLIFGVGMALLGYCPGTAVGAIGEGSRHAMAGVFGMLAGAALYAEFHQPLKALLGRPDLGKVTLPELTGSSPWLWIIGLAVAAVGLFAALEWFERRPTQRLDRTHQPTQATPLPGAPAGAR